MKIVSVFILCDFYNNVLKILNFIRTINYLIEYYYEHRIVVICANILSKSRNKHLLQIEVMPPHIDFSQNWNNMA